MRVYEQVAEELQQQGVTTIFGLIGQDTMRLAAVAATRGLRYVAARHEMGAVTMAAGYGRVTHTVAVAIVSRGPGLTNAMSGIVGAAKAGTPLIVLSGDEPLLQDGRGRDPKYVDQSAMLGAAGVRVTHPESAATAQGELRDAFDQARRGLTVAVLIPLDVLEADSRPLGNVPEAKAHDQRVSANAASVHAAADLIEGCGSDARIAIVAGRGAIATDSVAALSHLGEITGALMGTTIMAKSLFDSSANNLGVVGTFSSTPTREYLAGTDVLIAAGASLNPFTTQKGALFPSAVVIQIDVDHDAFGRYTTPNVPIHADVRSGAAELAAELERRGFKGRGRNHASIAPRSPFSTANGTIATSDDSAVLDPCELMRQLDHILPKERIVAVDAGHQLTFACAHLSVPDPDAFLFPIEFQCIGTALGMAIGAAIARTDLLTVVSLGDGALMMGLGELDTAIQLRLPLLLLIVNDGGFGAERHYLDMLGLPADTARFVNPAFKDIAIAMGADAMTIHTLNDLPALAAKLASTLTRPLLVDCLINDRVRAEWLESNLRREPAPGVALN
jgi:thiamine pyrophosphate-dependent acetolactate synthase large subunit-like protein